MKALDREACKYISYKLRLKNITYKEVAKSSGLSYSSISQILNGSKRIKRAESAIAASLGYESFSDLVEEAKREVARQTNSKATRPQ